MVNINELEEYLKDNLVEKRFNHVLRVRDMAKDLAKHYGMDEKKAEIAALGHDIAKNMKLDELKRIINENNIQTVFMFKDFYSKYQKDEPQETSAMNKMMTWSSLKMKTMTDSTTSKLAEILFQGFNMGIAEGRKLLNHKDLDEEVKDLVEEYVALQEESAAKVKEFL